MGGSWCVFVSCGVVLLFDVEHKGLASVWCRLIFGIFVLSGVWSFSVPQSAMTSSRWRCARYCSCCIGVPGVAALMNTYLRARRLLSGGGRCRSGFAIDLSVCRLSADTLVNLVGWFMGAYDFGCAVSGVDIRESVHVVRVCGVFRTCCGR